MEPVNTIYLIHHSHTDIGYTSDQPVVWDLQERFIDEALHLADKYADSPRDGAFRWTVESTVVLSNWLKYASSIQIDRFIQLEKAGRIEVTGMFANLTPLFDMDQLVESVQLIGQLRRDYGFTIRHAMNCDVNGESWSLVDVLRGAGIRSFSMAVNSAVGGFPFKQRPYPFWWQGPSGNKILAHLGFPYDKGWNFGIGHDKEALANQWWPTLRSHLKAIDYPLSAVWIQSFHPFGDNGSAYEGFVKFIDEWNAEDRELRLKLATPSQWVDAIANDLDKLPTHSGDWTDYWNFGCGSSAREQRINRASRDRLRSADGLYAAVSAANGDRKTSADRSMTRYRQPAWWNLNLYDEHTWGADISIWAPDCDDTASQWNHKAALAYQARSLSLMLQRDGLAELGRLVQREDSSDLLVYNPLPWPVKAGGRVLQHVIHPRGDHADATAGRHFQDHDIIFDLLAERASTGPLPDFSADPGFRYLLPVEVPGYGYTVVSAADLLHPKDVTTTHSETVLENSRFRVRMDMEKGGIASLYDKQLDHEWVDIASPYGCNRFLHEQVALPEEGADQQHPSPRDLICKLDWTHTGVEIQTGWKKNPPFERRGPECVTAYRVYSTPLGQVAVQHLKAPGIAGMLRQSVFLPKDGDYIEVESAWEMGVSTYPEATYLPFHLNLPNATVHLDLGGQGMQPGVDQLPGSCADYYTVQRWVDFSDGERGLVIATPDTPEVMLGGFHLADELLSFHLDQPLLLAWVTNNYWMTNFRAHQPGQVRARFCLLPYAGPFDEVRAHRFGAESALAQPIAQSLGESPAVGSHLPPTGSLLHLPQGDVLTLHIKHADQGNQMVLRLYNPTGQEQEAEVGSGLLQIWSAELCDLFENAIRQVDVEEGTVRLKIQARELVVLRLAAGVV